MDPGDPGTPGGPGGPGGPGWEIIWTCHCWNYSRKNKVLVQRGPQQCVYCCVFESDTNQIVIQSAVPFLSFISIHALIHKENLLALAVHLFVTQRQTCKLFLLTAGPERPISPFSPLSPGGPLSPKSPLGPWMEGIENRSHMEEHDEE